MSDTNAGSKTAAGTRDEQKKNHHFQKKNEEEQTEEEFILVDGLSYFKCELLNKIS